MVDIIRKKKKWGAKRLMTIGGILALALLIFSAFYFTRGGNKLNVEADRITISEIRQDKFQESIPENGTVMPLITDYIPTIDGGRVAEKYV
ncbi:MAG TPA: efflux transporter periplasmic adaptor subunit, partial [Puia sp.]|nr:efflux transporter periplasmic adaptor subunit [Puia sp.]